MVLTVEDLLAQESIRTVILRYFRAADRVDADQGTPTFWDDGHYVGGPIPGMMKDVLPALFGQMLPAGFEKTMHYITNLMARTEGDRGFAEAYCIGYQLLSGVEAIVATIGQASYDLYCKQSDRVEFLAGVRYAIELEQRGGEWRMLTMAPIIDWTRVQPYEGVIGDVGLLAAVTNRGQRDRSDLSYFGRDFAF